MSKNSLGADICEGEGDDGCAESVRFHIHIFLMVINIKINTKVHLHS